MTSAAPARKPYRKAPPQHRETRHALTAAPPPPAPQLDVNQEALSDSDRIRILQQQNEDLRRRLSLSTHKMEAMEAEFDGSRHYMEAELSRTRDDLDKMRDKFRRLQNSYTASQRTNQDLEEKLHALLRKVERDKKTMDQEIVELTNKLLDAKNTIDRLEELNERYRQDCNLAVQLLKCNKSHFRNHKFADLPYELQDMLNKHMKSSLPERGPASGSQDPDTLSLTPADVVPTSVIARVLEKPEPLLLNSAQSSSCSRPVAEDVFVHVDMTGPPPSAEVRGRENGQEATQQNGSCRSQSSLDGQSGGEEGGGGGAPSFEKLNPYPAPQHPHPLYPGRKVIEFSSDDKVKIPKNSPLPNCTYATRQAISLSLVQNEDERQTPGSPAPSSSSGGGGGANQRTPPSQRDAASEPLSSQSSPFSSPPQAPSVLASSGSSEEDLLANWQRMFVEKMAPSCDGSVVHRTSFSSQTAQELQRRRGGGGGGRGLLLRPPRAAYSDGEEGSSARSWTPSRGSSLDTDTDTEPRRRGGRYGGDGGSVEEGEGLLMNLEDDAGSGDTAVTMATSPADARGKELAEEEEEDDEEEERDVLPRELPVISPRLLDYTPPSPPPPPPRPQKSPKRMGVHHLHRKDSLTRAQEQGTLLD
ncbi:LOW QUALITY PROTEIN: tight junction-associated protein 1 [Scomber scombrus]|uniref:LOW QUALITY PROTEIN: tight junction-associated protein 1 n=1 Tax=Scomber scombrus TaxID=13677 RepID=UPI002DDA92AA|nr:LOW QUALITY PROTEIN: tight junction-associated protein 1 [Scomber scombrus]